MSSTNALPAALRALLMATVTVVLAACGGGGGNAATATPTTALTAPVLANLDPITLTKDDAAEGVVFANTGGAVQADGCAASDNLPMGLAVVVSSNNSCAITGAASVVNVDAVTVTVTATNATDNSMATVRLTVLDGATILTPPAQTPALTIGTALTAENAIVIPAGTQALAANSCAFVSVAKTATTPAQIATTVDGLTIATTAGRTDGTDGCSISGTLMPVTDTGASQRSYTISARGAAGGSFTATFSVAVSLAPTTAPSLPDDDIAAMAIDGIAIDELSIVNAAGGADITDCFFINDSNAQVGTLGRLTIATATGGRACLINGTLTGGTPQTFTIRALSGSGQDVGLDEATVIFTVMASSVPTLNLDDVTIDAELNAIPITPVTIANTNKNTGAVLVADSCKLVEADSTIITAGAVNGLTVGTTVDTTPAGGACTITGTPTTAGINTLRVRADTAEAMSNVLTLTFTVRQSDPASFTTPTISKRFDDVAFTNPVTAASGPSTFTWSSSDPTVANVNASTGEVSIVAVGTDVIITATRDQSNEYKAAVAAYRLTVTAFNPDLSDTTVDDVIVDGTPLAAPVTVSNANEAAAITECFFLNTGNETVTDLNGLSIAVDDNGGACAISGTLSGALSGPGSKTINIRALSASGQDDAMVTFTVAAKPLTLVKQISAGDSHTCAISADGDIYCWGAFADSRLGLSDVLSDSTAPARIGSDSDWIEVSAGGAHTCATKNGGELYCWGAFANGQLGLGQITDPITSVMTPAPATTPARIGSDSDWSQVSAGAMHTCAIQAGKLRCWGENTNGRLGLGNTTPGVAPSPINIGADTDWIQVSAGGAHTCAIKNDGELYCWGAGANGRLGLGDDLSDLGTPTRVGSESDWSQVSARNEHTCAVNSGGELHCWGGRGNGRLGFDATSVNTTTPTRASDTTDWLQVSTGDNHTCAKNTNGELYCFGQGGFGGLGIGVQPFTVATPTLVGDSTDWSQVSAGDTHTCAVSDAGRLHCWGPGDNGRLGLGDTTQRISPAPVTTAVTPITAPSLGNVDLTAAPASAVFNNAMLEGGSNIPPIIFINSGGDVQPAGCAVDTSSAQPDLPANLRIHPVTANGSVTCQITGRPSATAAMDTYTIVATNTVGSATAATVSFAVIAVGPIITDIAGKQTFFSNATIEPIIFTNGGLAVQTDGCTISPELPTGLEIGTYDDEGTMTCRITGAPVGEAARTTYIVSASSAGGAANKASISIETLSKPLNLVRQVDTGDLHTCAVSGGGDLYCWGQGVYGQLGLGDDKNRNNPTRVGGSTDWLQVSGGFRFGCSLRTGGDLFCSGRNNLGQIGSDDAGMANLSHIQVDSEKTWAQISAGGTHSCAINAEGQLYCWGEGALGRLGLGDDTSTRTIPTQVGSAINWVQVSAGSNHTCAINAEGQLYCWGLGNSGRLGLGTDTSNRNSPAQVGSATNWSQVSAGSTHACAVDTGGQLYCWGSGANGRLGLGPVPINRFIPTQVGSATNWSQVSTFISSANHSCAINTEGQLYCWGKNDGGQLGIGDDLSARNTPQAVTTARAAETAPNLASLTLSGSDGMLAAGQFIEPFTFTNTGGDVQPAGCTISRTPASRPALPAGLRVHPAVSGDTVTCQITGIPTAAAATATYHIVATNAIGTATTTATVAFQVSIVRPLLANIATAQTYTTTTAITALSFTNTGLDVTGCTASPTLPMGLSVAVATISSKATCQITGTPNTATDEAIYTITATSASGTDTARVSIEVEAM
ncbi:MAG: hypothetical protein K0U66_01390 [Gammaproteobacteria bacterium]|nr:hypothetical protein [Gammaproteobacteria bacterium]